MRGAIVGVTVTLLQVTRYFVPSSIQQCRYCLTRLLAMKFVSRSVNGGTSAGSTLDAVAQLDEALSYKPEVCGSDS